MYNFTKNIVMHCKGRYSYTREGDFVIYPSIDKLLNVVDSKYQLVHIAARRSKEMSETLHYQMKENQYTSKKDIGRALEEIAEGLISIKMES